MNDKNTPVEKTTPAKKSLVTATFIAVILAIAAIWFFMARRDTPERIEPANSDTTNSTNGIPPDSLRH